MGRESVNRTQPKRRFRKAQEAPGRNDLGTLTPVQIVNPDWPGIEHADWKDEIIREWESDWSEI